MIISIEVVKKYSIKFNCHSGLKLSEKQNMRKPPQPDTANIILNDERQ